MAADEPGGDGLVELVETARKEMVGVIDDAQLVFTSYDCDEFGNFGSGAILIVCAMDKELGFVAAPEIREIGAIDGNAEANQVGDTRIGAANTKANPASETETGEKQGNTRKFRGKKIDGGLNVALLTVAAVV